MNGTIQHILFCVWLSLLNIIFVKNLYCHYICSLSLLFCWWTFRFFPIRGSYTECCNEHYYTCLLVHIYICISVGYTYRTDIAGSKKSHEVSLSRYCQTGLQSGCVKYEYFKLFPSWIKARFGNCWTWKKHEYLKAVITLISFYCSQCTGQYLTSDKRSTNIYSIELNFPQVLISEKQWSSHFTLFSDHFSYNFVEHCSKWDGKKKTLSQPNYSSVLSS